MDYEKIGLKIGLEIHQRLESHKLFCNCPSVMRDDKPDIIVIRRLRAVAGEAGDVDVAAKFEMEKGLQYVYEGYSDTTCNVEFDEQPPGPLNLDALEIALQIALLLNAKPVNEVHVMRKTVVDGSNTSGFQRTALIAKDGYVETSKGKVGIGYVYLEEEAAKNVKEEENSRVWRLDRLGIPLVEIQTKPDIKTPEHAKEVAELLGMILRSTGRVKHGLGSIRQDINLSINGGARVEIKGFQDLRSIPKVVEYEVKRQLELIEAGKKVQSDVRKANPDNTTSFMRPMPGSARMYPETDVLPVIISDDLLSKITLPELLSERAMRLENKYKISADLAREIVKSKIEFEVMVGKLPNVEPSFIAHTLVETPKEIKRRFKLDGDKIRSEDMLHVLTYLNDGLVTKDAVIELLCDVASGKKIDVSKYKSVSTEQLEKDIKKIIDDNKGAPFNALMGEVMKKYRGKVDGKLVAELIKKLL
ncbi:MAG: Glu-tRNA(Gln) amidotransferase subunit GatE [Candidatus Nanoarchaeia archaeon]